MSPRIALAAAAVLTAGALAALLGTEELGLGRAPRGGAAWPHLLEDWYDRFSYQQRGRFLASGGAPYLDEFSEYPQLATWLMSVPYRCFDHGVLPGEPFGARRGIAPYLAAAGLDANETLDLEKSFRAVAYDDGVARAALPPLRGPLERLAAATSQAVALEALPAFARAWREIRSENEELLRNRRGYGDVHHVLMALALFAFAAVMVANLRARGHAAGYALLSFLPASLYFAFNRFDVVVALELGLALLFHVRGRPILAQLCLAAGFLTKLVPVILMPMFAAQEYRRLRRTAGRGAAFRAAVLLPLSVAALAAAAVAAVFTWRYGGGLEGFWFPFEWQGQRREPNHASLLALMTNAERWGWLDYAWRDDLERVFRVLQVLPALLLALVPLRTERAFLLAGLVALGAAVSFSQFFSPQWILWLAPFALLLAPSARGLLALFVAFDVVLYVQLPVLHYHCTALGQFDAFWNVTALRTAVQFALLGAAAALLAVAARRAPAPA